MLYAKASVHLSVIGGYKVQELSSGAKELNQLQVEGHIMCSGEHIITSPEVWRQQIVPQWKERSMWRLQVHVGIQCVGIFCLFGCLFWI